MILSRMLIVKSLAMNVFSIRLPLDMAKSHPSLYLSPCKKFISNISLHFFFCWALITAPLIGESTLTYLHFQRISLHKTTEGLSKALQGKFCYYSNRSCCAPFSFQSPTFSSLYSRYGLLFRCFLYSLCSSFFSLAETNRIPFDLPKAEAELVAVYNVEYTRDVILSR